jgi:dUTP pyrophosphatase
MNIKLDKGITMPTKANKTDCGWDLYSPIDFGLEPGEVSERINLGVAFEIPPYYCGQITERSSQGKKGVHTIGNTIDSGYIGNVHVTLVNSGRSFYSVSKGDRICQIYFPTIYTGELKEVKKLKDTSTRGTKAHGSSGI